MILGVGIDLTNTKRFLDKDCLAKKIMTNEEYIEYSKLSTLLKSSRLAKTWAIKEAFYKACPEHVQQIISWKNVECTHTEYGKPIVNINIAGINYSVYTSLSDEADMVTAVVILEEQ
jgi:phosphopantetheine--protein transferase-like protein